MTAEEKAKELFDKMYLVEDIMGGYPMCFDTAKKCAIIAVKEMLSKSPLNGNVIAQKYRTYWLEVLRYLDSF